MWFLFVLNLWQYAIPYWLKIAFLKGGSETGSTATQNWQCSDNTRVQTVEPGTSATWVKPDIQSDVSTLISPYHIFFLSFTDFFQVKLFTSTIVMFILLHSWVITKDYYPRQPCYCNMFSISYQSVTSLWKWQLLSTDCTLVVDVLLCLSPTCPVESVRGHHWTVSTDTSVFLPGKTFPSCPGNPHVLDCGRCR